MLIKIIILSLVIIQFSVGVKWYVSPTADNLEPLIVLLSTLTSAVVLISRWRDTSSYKSENKQSANENSYNIGVNHVVPIGEGEWASGWSGFLISRVGIFIVINLCIILYLAPNVIPIKDFYDKTALSFESGISILELFNLILTLSFLLYFFLANYVRHRTKRSLRMKSEIHKLLHECRDEICDLLDRNKLQKSAEQIESDRIHEKKHLLEFSTRACNIIKDYFQVVCKDDTVSCAIRIASIIDDKSIGKKDLSENDIGYYTVGRSDNMNRYRAKTSKCIRITEGIPHFFKALCKYPILNTVFL